MESLAEHFKFCDSPLRPSSDDVAIVRQQLLSLKTPVHGVLLGVTQELSELASGEIHITAVDKSATMIDHQWIGNTSNRILKLGDWFELPSIVTNLNFVIGDGVFNVIDRKSQHCLMDCVRLALADNGLLITRIQCNPEIRESLKDILESTTSNLVEFWCRLVASSVDSNFEVRPREVFKIFKETISTADITRFGWTTEQLSLVEAFENSPYVMTFLTETMFRQLCDEHGMTILSKSTGSYKHSELWPTFTLRKV